ncbi:MAG: Ig-like domain repeat protein [Verrucomicrobia bacterium]|nr:Ig-like domain repeat protein [Verrucomicrobiota bacterium]
MRVSTGGGGFEGWAEGSFANGDSGNKCAWLDNSQTSFADKRNPALPGNPVAKYGEWHNLTLTWDGTVLSAYWDGVLNNNLCGGDGQSTANPVNIPAGTPITLGGYVYYQGTRDIWGAFNGAIANLVMLDGALDAAGVAALVNEMNPITAPAATATLALTSGDNPSAWHAPVTFTATVTGTTPTGDVTFKDGTTTIGTATLALVGANYEASLTTSSLAPGTHSLTAVYPGDSNNGGCTSSALEHVVSPGDPVRLIDVSSTGLAAGPLTSWPNAGTLGGTFEFTGGGTYGSETYPGTPVNVGTTGGIVAAQFTGGGVNYPSGFQVASSMQLKDGSGAYIPLPGANTGNGSWTVSTWAYKISQNPPTGNEAETLLCWAPWAQPAGGTQMAAVNWGGFEDPTDSAYRGSGGTGSSYAHLSWLNPTGNNNALLSDNPVQKTGAWHNITMTYDGATHTMSAYFDGALNNSTVISGGLNVQSGQAITLGGLNWDGRIWASLNGAIGSLVMLDGALADETAVTALMNAINPSAAPAATATLALTSGVTPSAWHAPVTITATVTGTTPTGDVTFKDGTTPIGTGTLALVGANYQASLTTSLLSPGTHSLTAVYTGDTNNGGCTSLALSHEVSTGGDPARLIDISSAGLAAGPLASWPNAGLLGGTFEFTGGGTNGSETYPGTPVTVGTTGGVVAAQFTGIGSLNYPLSFQNASSMQLKTGSGAYIPLPGFNTGNGSWTVSTWAYKNSQNPPSGNEAETLLCWAPWAQPAGGTQMAAVNWGGFEDPTDSAYRGSGGGSWALLSWLNPSGSNNAQASDNPVQQTGAWHNITMTYDGATQTMSAYFDGALNNSTVISSGLNVQSGQAITLGGLNWDGRIWASLNGAIANLVMLDGALDAAGVTALVNEMNPVTASTPYQTWAASKGLDGTAGKENGQLDDPDKDGVKNVAEFAFNGDPLSGADNGKIYSVIAAAPDYNANPAMILTIAVRAGTTFSSTSAANLSNAAPVDGLTYTIDGSYDLSTFDIQVQHNSSIYLPAGVSSNPGVGYVFKSFTLVGSEMPGGVPKGFLRAKVESNP